VVVRSPTFGGGNSDWWDSSGLGNPGSTGDTPHYDFAHEKEVNECKKKLNNGLIATQIKAFLESKPDLCQSESTLKSKFINDWCEDAYSVKDENGNYNYPKLSDFTPMIEKQEAIMNQYSYLDCDKIVCITDDPEFEAYLSGLNESEIYDPCTGKGTEDIISDAFDVMADKGGCSMENFKEALDGADWILLDNSFLSNEKINCVWENIIMSNNDLMCTTLDNFFGPTKLNLNIYVQNLTGLNGYTTILPSGNLSISIDIDFINKACPIELLKTILHEAIHAKLYNECWPEGVSYNDYVKGFAACAKANYLIDIEGLPENQQHIVMTKWFVEQIGIAIYDYFGGNGGFEDYEYLAWQGLSQYPEYANEQWFIDYLNESKIRYENNNLPVSDPCPQ